MGALLLAALLTAASTDAPSSAPAPRADNASRDCFTAAVPFKLPNGGPTVLRFVQICIEQKPPAPAKTPEQLEQERRAAAEAKRRAEAEAFAECLRSRSNKCA